ncbi:MAG: hypothetical protein AAB414_03605 [Patescibacteria group bacterium]
MKYLLVLLLVTCYLLLPHPIRAADSTPSADIKSKLEELKKEIASKAAKLKQEVNKKLQNKAYVGLLKTKSDTSITLASNTGPKLISINQDTAFESKVKNRQKISLKGLSEEDYITALGDVDETQVLTAKKVILLPKAKPSTKTYLWGKIISEEAKLATLLGRDQKNTAVSIPKDVKVRVSDFIIATGRYNENDIFEAEFVYVIKQGGILKPKKSASPSASIKASPSLKPATKSTN